MAGELAVDDVAAPGGGSRPSSEMASPPASTMPAAIAGTTHFGCVLTIEIDGLGRALRPCDDAPALGAAERGGPLGVPGGAGASPGLPAAPVLVPQKGHRATPPAMDAPQREQVADPRNAIEPRA
jgi:hypothetical protein